MRAILLGLLTIGGTPVLGQSPPVPPGTPAGRGSYIDLEGGRGATGNFVLTTLPQSGSTQANRMVFADIKPNSFVWRWQATQDGKAWVDS